MDCGVFPIAIKGKSNRLVYLYLTILLSKLNPIGVLFHMLLAVLKTSRKVTSKNVIFKGKKLAIMKQVSRSLGWSGRQTL